MAVITMQDVHRMRKLKTQDVNRTWRDLVNMGRMSFDPSILGPFTGIRDVWKNEPAIVVGAGPSLKDFDLSQIDNMHSIGINHVIEDYDNFEYFLFLDDRFLSKTTYDINKYKGKIFSSNKCRNLPGLNNVRFKTRSHKDKIDLNIEKGLFNGMLSALSALHLALITGANPIYLIGVDCGGGTPDNYHYKVNYTGASKGIERHKKYEGTAGFFKAFTPYKDRIKNMSEISNIKTFEKASVDEFKKDIKPVKRNKEPVVCHVIKMNNMEEMGDISRQVYSMGYGKHIYCRLGEKLPKADIYLLECFINGAKQFEMFDKPKGSKVISLIHSSSSCKPAKCSDEVIVLTKAWQDMYTKRGTKSKWIHAAIDTQIYHKRIDYTNKVFGRITRYSPGKVHPNWNQVMLNVLERVEESKCIMFTGRNARLTNHERLTIDDSIKINDHELKAEKLAQLSIFADMHNTFVETFSLCLLEAMAAGLAIVLYSKTAQPSMIEVIGDAGIICKTEKEFEDTIVRLLNNPEEKKEWGSKARLRAEEFTVTKMIDKYDKIFKDLHK
jgi:glycosyltransferase involved in cell wall biosynthesis